MQIDPKMLDSSERYELLCDCVVPRPIAWVGTSNEDDTPNLAPFSFFNCLSATPPILGLGVGPHREKKEKDTLRNLRRTGEFTVNFPRIDQLAQVVASADDLPYGDSEFKHCDLTPVKGNKVEAPMVLETGISFECLVSQIIKLEKGSTHLVLARIVLIHIQDELYSIETKEFISKYPALARWGTNHFVTMGRFLEFEEISS